MSQNDFYNQQPRHLVAVDCAIFGYQSGELKLLLCRRSFEPALGEWSLMGGFVQDSESLEETARRVLFQTTGLKDIFLDQVAAFSRIDRDPVGRVISMAFVALIRIDEHDQKLVKENEACWWSLKSIPDLIFDHTEMVKKSLEAIQKRASYELTGRELLPEKCTLTELRSLYEAIFQRDFDPGNFRKKVLSLNVLERLEEKDKTGSKKGAFYYRFRDREEFTNGDRIFKIHKSIGEV